MKWELGKVLSLLIGDEKKSGFFFKSKEADRIGYK